MNRKLETNSWVLAVAMWLLPLLAFECFAAGLDTVAVMSLSPVDSRAVVKLEDGRMRVLKPGDTIDGTGATLVQVLEDKLVLEEVMTDENGGKAKTTVWLHKAKNGVSQVQRLEQDTPASQPLEVHKTPNFKGKAPQLKKR